MTNAFGNSGEGAATSGTSSTPTWPVVIEARHVRLSAAHVEMLFGAGHALLELVWLPPTGRFASADVVDVRGPSGTLKGVRVLGPIAGATRVYLSDDDVADCGLDGNRAGGVSIDGPRGTLVLAAGAVLDVRRLVVPRQATGPSGETLDVLVRGERARELRGMPVEQNGDANGGGVGDDANGGPWLAIDIANANAMDIGPLTRATASSRG